MNLLSLTRRQTLAGIAATSALPLLSNPAFAQAADPAADARANALLDSVADNLLRLYPEQATQLGIDKGDRVRIVDIEGNCLKVEPEHVLPPP